ncbi:Deoxycytidylate deaminase, partial [Geodia barretti]
GACLVSKEIRRVVSVGSNGFVDGFSDGYVCCAEFNGIMSAFRYNAELTSATLYTTGAPCPRCAIKIVQSQIKTVIYGGHQMEREAEKTLYWGKVATL